MKAVCPTHVYAYDAADGCPWCVSAKAPLPDSYNRFDVYLPHPTSAKGYACTFRHTKPVPVMVYLRESYVVDASVATWFGTFLKPAVSVANGSYLEKAFCIDMMAGSWVASYLGHDGEVWKSHLMAETVNDEWVFTVKEYT